MVSYRLLYFDQTGRGEILRFLFALGGQKYEDVIISQESWPKFKQTVPFGVLPVLEIDGKRYSQSVALAVYLAKQFGYNGKTDLESLAVLEVVQLVQDFISASAKTFYEPDAAKKAELVKNYLNVDLPKYMGFFKNLLEKNNTGYFVGNSLTLADLALFDFLRNLRKNQPTVTDNFPVVKALTERVDSNPKIRDYLNNRKPLPQ